MDWHIRHQITSCNDMSTTYNVYCDESCHLPNDTKNMMVLGAIWCPAEKCRDVSVRLREIKVRHGLRPTVEVKWTKISPSKQQLFVELVDFFFENNDLQFQSLIVQNKNALDHAAFNQTHDEWYDAMYARLFQELIDPTSRYRIYLDIKDTRSATRVAHLHTVLLNAQNDFAQEVVERIQTVRSHEVEILQLADILIGAVSYAHRGLSGNLGKEAVIARLRQRSKTSLLDSSFSQESKIHIIRWSPRSPDEQ